VGLWLWKLVFVGASIACFCLPAFAATAEQLLEHAKILEKEGCSAEAISYLDQAIAKGLKRPANISKRSLILAKL